MECHHHHSGNRTPIFHLPLLVSRFFLAALRSRLTALNGKAPSYITELLKPYVPTRNLRSSSKNLLKVPPVKLNDKQEKTMSFFGFTGVILAIPSSVNVTGSLGGGEESITLFG
ncbi:hypothetical protein pdam_00009695 [Pocillopora damicornis]|uniref:Amino acid permease/ SLC12A domain-containing protein n=1 Tax=Pocillopora damicornis TaxID=46731 RepID=A0A3M6UAA4_POCDA|nr:hypothetical protein pdam_00009695 [Pocillopora damicornis]